MTESATIDFHLQGDERQPSSLARGSLRDERPFLRNTNLWQVYCIRNNGSHGRHCGDHCYHDIVIPPCRQLIAGSGPRVKYRKNEALPNARYGVTNLCHVMGSRSRDAVVNCGQQARLPPFGKGGTSVAFETAEFLRSAANGSW